FAAEAPGARFAPLATEPPSIENLARAASRYEQKRAQDRARLASMLRYAQSHLCRTRLLLTYFGYADGAGEPCGVCDNCRRAARSRDERAPAGEMPEAAADGEAGPLVKELARRRARAAPPRALKVERRRRRSTGPFDKGDVVRHQTWGEGEVVRIQGDTVGAFFPGHGEKLLKASFLRKIDPT
ncbi:MAG TPA: RecQ family zinc-binding domain-containing protein, partial [Kofleriaceae bacterium]|nr:RecQ family zinc-binding domain-containing protein [Kofleriaceae bacterium]